jgi:hypothetical protein
MRSTKMQTALYHTTEVINWQQEQRRRTLIWKEKLDSKLAQYVSQIGIMVNQ